MEYSAVIQPPITFCSFIQRGTDSSTVTPQITLVFPHSTRVEPVACGAMWFWKRMGRSCEGERPSARMAEMMGIGSVGFILARRDVKAALRQDNTYPSPKAEHLGYRRNRPGGGPPIFASIF